MSITRRTFLNLSGAASVAAFLPAWGIAQKPATELMPGWLICDGAYLDSAKYPELFSVLGHAYGEFTLPDFRGRAMIEGVSQGAPSAVTYQYAIKATGVRPTPVGLIMPFVT